MSQMDNSQIREQSKEASAAGLPQAPGGDALFEGICQALSFGPADAQVLQALLAAARPDLTSRAAAFDLEVLGQGAEGEPADWLLVVLDTPDEKTSCEAAQRVALKSTTWRTFCVVEQWSVGRVPEVHQP